MKKFLDQSEAKGVGILKSHSGLTKGELVSLVFTNNITSGVHTKRKVELKLSSNKTIYSLRYQIARNFKCLWNEIKLIRLETQQEITDSDNGKTIGDLRLKNAETFTVQPLFLFLNNHSSLP